MLSRHDAGPGWRADRAGGIRIGESHTLPGQPVDIRCFVESAAIAAELIPAEVIGKNQDDIRVDGRGLSMDGEGEDQEL